MKLSPNQLIVIQETVQFDGRSAHTECRTMKALEKKGLVICTGNNFDNWKPTELAKQLYS
jgi:hypothetical protein